MKMATGCRDPFNPLYSYRDYPVWKRGYNRGRSEIIKAVKKIIDDLQVKSGQIVKNLESQQSSHIAEDLPKAEPAKEPTK